MADDFTPTGKAARSADHARQVIGFYTDLVGGDINDVETQVADLLADLMHLCDVVSKHSEEEARFDAALDRARFHYDAEKD